MKIVNPRPIAHLLLENLDIEKWIEDCFRSLMVPKEFLVQK